MRRSDSRADFRDEGSPAALGKLRADPYPSPGSPMDPFEQRMWKHLRSHGLAVQPLR